MAAGLVPICLESCSGVAEVIQQRKNGILVQDRENSFSEAVSFLIKNPGAWTAFSAAARQTIRERYSAEACTGKWKALLVADAPSVSIRRRPRLRLRLPPHNPKFGRFDQRKPGQLRRAWNRLRQLAGSGRRRAADFVRSISHR